MKYLNNHLLNLNFLLIVALIILFITTGCKSVAEEFTANLTIDGSIAGPDLHRLVFGSNLQWEHYGDGIYDPTTGHIKREVIGLINELGITALRYPGGTLADSFDWRASIGPLSYRGYGKTFGGKLEKIYFGLDEFLRLCEDNNIEPVITVNFNISPEDAADLVEYINGAATTEMGKLRAANGHPAPYGVHFFEIGNEIYSTIEPGHCSVDVYADKFKTMREAMLAIDPNIKLGACCEIAFQKAPWVSSYFPHLLNWNKRLAELVGNDIDFLSCHFYGPFDTSSNRERLLNNIFALPKLFSDTIHDVRELFPSRIKIAVTEYNLGFGDKAPLDPMIAGYESALFAAVMLKKFIEDEIMLANHWSLIGNSVFGMIQSSSSLGLRPSWHMMKAIINTALPYTLETNIKSPLYDVSGLGSVPPMSDIPWLHALVFADEPAAASGKQYMGNMSIILINCNQSNNIKLSISFQNVREIHSADVSIYEKGSMVAGINTVKQTQDTIEIKSSSFQIDIPPASLMIIHI